MVAHKKKEKIWLRLNYRLSSIRLDTGVELAIVEVVISLNFEISFFFSNSKFWGVYVTLCVHPTLIGAKQTLLVMSFT